MTTKEQISEAFKTAVLARLKLRGGDGTPNAKANGWGGEDSVAVIEAIVDAAYLGDSPEGFDAVKANVAALVNPSQFRQRLEAKKLVAEGVKRKRSAGADVLAGF